jgi:hypothetical protein
LVVSHEKKFIYLQNPKTGSETVNSVLIRYSIWGKCGDYSLPCADHQPARVLKNYFDENGFVWKDYFVFTTIRNPWDRAVSYYTWAKLDKNGQPAWSPLYIKNTSISFSDYVSKIIKPDSGIDGFCTPIKYFGCDEKGNKLYDKLIRTEEINTELPKIAKRLGLKIGKIPHIHKTEHEDYRQYYTTPQIRNRIKKIFESDIAEGKYDFKRGILG